MPAETTLLFRGSVVALLASGLIAALATQPMGALFPVILTVVATAVFLSYPPDTVGEWALPGVFDYVVYLSGSFLLLVVGTWTAVTQSYGSFFVLASTLLGIGVFMIRWQCGLALLLLTGVFGSFYTLTFDVLGILFLGIPWFLSIVLLSALCRYGEEISGEMNTRDVFAAVVAFGLILAIPLVAWGMVAPSVQPTWTMAEVDVEGSAGSDSTPSMIESIAKIGLILAVGVGLLMGVYWIMRRIDRDEEELSEEVEMPDEEMAVEKTASSATDNLQRVVRGGRSADVLQQVHGLLNRVRSEERNQSETVSEFLLERFSPDPIDREDTLYVARVYDGARYGFREPTADQFQEFQTIVERMIEDVE